MTKTAMQRIAELAHEGMEGCDQPQFSILTKILAIAAEEKSKPAPVEAKATAEGSLVEISCAEAEGEGGRCKYQEDNKNCTAKKCPYHAIRGTTSDGTCILHPKPIGTNGPYLPKGRTCRSCLHTAKCKELGIYNPDATMCDWDPCRYAEYHGDMTPKPMFMIEICEALGWQGGTVHEAIKEIKKLKKLDITGWDLLAEIEKASVWSDALDKSVVSLQTIQDIFYIYRPAPTAVEELVRELQNILLLYDFDSVALGSLASELVCSIKEIIAKYDNAKGR